MNQTFVEFLFQATNSEKTRNFANYSLKPLQTTLEKFGLPWKTHRPFCISVVGTNGKGSISHFLEEIFRTHSQPNLKTGLYTSPHLLSPWERIQTNRENIPEEELESVMTTFQDFTENLGNLSFFELMTLASFVWFENQKVDVAIFEAGLGGRLDATKLAKSDVVVLGKIGMDHKEILGDSLEKILTEKLEIATDSTQLLFSFPQEHKSLDDQIETFCRKKNIRHFFFAKPFEGDYLSFNQEYCYSIAKHLQTEVSLFQNRLQIPNSPQKLSKIPGRLELLRPEPILLFDTAHNPDAVEYLLKSLKNLYPNLIWRVFWSTLGDKDTLEILNVHKRATNVSTSVYMTKQGFANAPIGSKQMEFALGREEIFKSSEPILVHGSFRIYSELKK